MTRSPGGPHPRRLGAHGRAGRGRLASGRAPARGMWNRVRLVCRGHYARTREGQGHRGRLHPQRIRRLVLEHLPARRQATTPVAYVRFCGSDRTTSSCTTHCQRHSGPELGRPAKGSGRASPLYARIPVVEKLDVGVGQETLASSGCSPGLAPRVKQSSDRSRSGEFSKAGSSDPIRSSPCLWAKGNP
jgi:hypothetical protein